MAYLGTPPRSRVLSSADIDPGSISLDDISFTDQPTNLNLTGTYDKHTMRLADGVTVVGDVTISDNLVLSKISDDGNAITLTNDTSTRTITGSGSLEASTLTQTPNASLTGMTGELGSAVTGSPLLNLSNATQFPSGHVIQTVFHKLSASETGGTPTRNSTSWGVFSGVGFKKAITPLKSNSDILINLSLIISDSDDATLFFRLYDNTNAQYIGIEGADGLFGGRQYKSWNTDVISYNYLYESPTIASTPNSIEIELHTKSSATVYLNRRMQDASWGRHTSTMILQEISR